VHPPALLVKLMTKYGDEEEGEEEGEKPKGTSGEVFAIWILISAEREMICVRLFF